MDLVLGADERVIYVGGSLRSEEATSVPLPAPLEALVGHAAAALIRGESAPELPVGLRDLDVHVEELAGGGRLVRLERRDQPSSATHRRTPPAPRRAPTIPAAMRAGAAAGSGTEEELRDALELRDEFLAVLSHELRAPLSAISHAGQLLAETPEGPGARKAIEVVLRQSEHARHMLGDLLDVVRIRRGQLRLTRRQVPLRRIIDDALDAIRAVAASRDIALEVEQELDGVTVHGDGTRLAQLFADLLRNAVQFSPRGAAVAVRGEISRGRARIDIVDVGPGILPGTEEMLFELFYQQTDQGLARRQGGLGVGLSLARSIARAHGGDVNARANPEGGMAFSVELPTMAEPAASMADRDRVEAAGSRRLRVVVVEDQADNREMLGLLLRRRGHDVQLAADGEEGLRLILETRPDLAIVDIGLPGASGYEVAAQVRRGDPGGRIFLLALTGYGRPRDRARAFASGFDEHIPKPLKRGQLDALLERLGRPNRRSAPPPPAA